MTDIDAGREVIRGLTNMALDTQTSTAKPTGRPARIRPILTACLLAIALARLLPASPAMAASPPPAANLATPAEATGAAELDARTVDREIASFRAAAVSLQQAMTIAQKRHRDSSIADISFDSSSGRPAYQVKTLQGDHVLEHAIDADTGAVIGGEIVTPLSELDAEDRRNLAALRGLRQQLADAVVLAERVTSGRALSGGLTREAGNLSFAIVVISDEGLKKVLLQPPRSAKR
jgi:hypothetical protein